MLKGHEPYIYRCVLKQGHLFSHIILHGSMNIHDVLTVGSEVEISSKYHRHVNFKGMPPVL